MPFLLTEKDLCECRNVKIKFLSALLLYLCLSSGELLIFLCVSPFVCYHDKKWSAKQGLHEVTVLTHEQCDKEETVQKNQVVATLKL